MRNGAGVPANGSAIRDKSSLAAPNEQANGTGNRALISALVNSKIYREYEQAFTDLTGLPVALQPVETWQLPHHGKRNENPFCVLVSQKSRACAACLQVQERLCEKATHEPQTVTCPVGLCDTAVPVRLSDKLIGFLQTGQLFRKKPSKAQFERAAKLVAEWGIDADRDALAKGVFFRQGRHRRRSTSRRSSCSRFSPSIWPSSATRSSSSRKTPRCRSSRRPRNTSASTRPKKFRSAQVAKAVNMSAFYFCKMFKKVTGINFTDYLSRVRIERAKNLLLNPNLRVSEIAFEVGFQSLTHFNRVFKKIAGPVPHGLPRAIARALSAGRRLSSSSFPNLLPARCPTEDQVGRQIQFTSMRAAFRLLFHRHGNKW